MRTFSTLLACLLLPLLAACSESKPLPPTAAGPVPKAAAPSDPAPQPVAATPPHFHIIEHARTPTARTEDGCTTLELDREWHSLRYRRGSAPTCPSFEQSLDLLHEMLLAFDALGDLRSATSLGLGRDYAAYFQRLARAAARSPDWDARRGMPKQGGATASNAFVVRISNDATQFFPEVVELLRGTHMRAELRSVEKVLVGTAKSTPFADEILRDGIPPEAKLPFDCIVGFHLVNESEGD